jgi:TRAP-type C4-dicarboxylate transport system permease small subunit
LRALRKGLDGLYLISGILAACFLIAILTLIVVQMVARWTGEIFPGAPEYAGYSMAGASFLAFASALNHGSHIRVSILINAVPARVSWFLNVWCFTIGTMVGWYVAYYAWRFTYWSWKFSDISQGQDATLLWIPQSSMVIGSVILAIALTDHLISLLFTGRDRIHVTSIE